MTVVRYEPWALLNRLHRELDQTFDTVARDASWSPAVDIHEEAERFVVSADLPGVKPADIEITADKGVLSLRGAAQLRTAQDRRPLLARRARQRQVRPHFHAAGQRAVRSPSRRSSRTAYSSSRSPRSRSPSRAASRSRLPNEWGQTSSADERRPT